MKEIRTVADKVLGTYGAPETFTLPLQLFTLALALFLLLPAHAAESDEVAGIPLLTTTNYDPRDEEGRALKRFFSGIGVAIAGPGKDLKKEILDKMNQEELKSYFPDARERDRIAQRIADGMRDRYLANGYNNRNTLGAFRFATSELIATVVKRVLEKEGLRDTRRAALWSNKILASYHSCMNEARTYSEGGKCGTAVEADLIKNMGLAMSYELTRQEFSASYARPRPKEFAACVKPNRPGANERVKNCALQGFKNAAKAFGRARILDVAKKQMSQATADRVVAKVMPGLERCLNASRERTGFVQCGDKLIAAAGSELAAEAILEDGRVKSYFPESADRMRIAGAGRDAFARCMAENEKKKLRDANGTLRTDNCEIFVKMETARVVATEVLRQTVEKNMAGASIEERARQTKDSGEALALCWNSTKPESENATCLRSVAKKIAASIAREKLGRELPKDVAERDPAFRDRLLKNFEGCLEEKLPQNLFTDTNADIAAESCAAGIYREAALQVAESKVRAALASVSDQIPNSSAMDALIDSFVKKAFAECLGERPDTARLESCSLKLQKNVASAIAQALLPFKVDEFIRKGGGLEAYGLNPASRQELLNSVITAHKTCLRTTVKSTKSDESGKEIDACFKTTIRDLALRLGALEVERMAKANAINVTSPAFAELKNDFAKEFGACLDEKKDASIPLDDYLKNMEPCQAKISKSLTVKIAKAELAKVIGEVFTENSRAPEREQLEARLVAGFDTCMEKASDANAREACVKKLKADATLALVRVGVEGKALKELGEVPEDIRQLGQQLESCVAGGGASDDCSRRYLKGATVSLAKKILQKTLSDMAADYNAIAPKLKGVEQALETCVEGVSGAVDQNFLKAVESCGTTYANDGLDVAIKALSETPPAPGPGNLPGLATATRPEKDMTEKELSEMMSRAMLCLNGQLSPDTENSLDSIDPESMEAELLKLIGGYVSYDLKAAQGNFEGVLAKVAEDLKAAGPEAARRKLLDELVKGGMIDQLLRAMIRGELERSLAALPEIKKPPEALKAALLDKAALDKALSTEVLEKVRPLMSSQVLEPVLVDGKSLRSSAVLRSLRSVKNLSLGAVLASPALDAWKDDPALNHLRDALR